jgi:hypothetical protein
VAELPDQKNPPPGMIVRYGYAFPRDHFQSELAIELHFYANFKTMPKPSGHPREYHFSRAFKMMWPDFEWHEWCELMIWAWCNYRLICVIGCTRASKTYFTAHLVLLDYLAAEDRTATTLTTTKFDALKARMWGDLMRAAESMPHQLFENFEKQFKITSTTNEMNMTAITTGQHGGDKFMIQGVATDSADKSAGKIRGQHADRRRIVGDEAQDIAEAIYTAFSNAMSAPDFIGVLLSNPVDRNTPFGKWCKPKGGWDAIADTTVHWETEKPHGICLHFDGLQSPNLKLGEDRFPFLFTRAYCETIRAVNGEDSLEWWMYVRGFFPPDGLVPRVFPSSTLARGEAAPSFDFPPTPVASLDPAYESDDCVLTLGVLSTLRTGIPCIRATQSIKIKLKEGPGADPKEYQIAHEVMRICGEEHITPENFIMDTTGNGRGVYAVLLTEWSRLVQKIEYGGEATMRPLRLSDPKPANEQVRYFVAELWFRASFLMQEGMLCGLKQLDEKTIEDLNSRRYTVKQFGEIKLMVVETKAEMKARLGRSPDFGDSYVQFGELMVRKGLLKGVVDAKPKATGSRWDHFKKLAKKASSRFSEAQEYSHN